MPPVAVSELLLPSVMLPLLVLSKAAVPLTVNEQLLLPWNAAVDVFPINSTAVMAAAPRLVVPACHSVGLALTLKVRPLTDSSTLRLTDLIPLVAVVAVVAVAALLAQVVV